MKMCETVRSEGMDWDILVPTTDPERVLTKALINCALSSLGESDGCGCHFGVTVGMGKLYVDDWTLQDGKIGVLYRSYKADGEEVEFKFHAAVIIVDNDPDVMVALIDESGNVNYVTEGRQIAWDQRTIDMLAAAGISHLND